jgi:iron complex outermembrane receptor protein
LRYTKVSFDSKDRFICTAAQVTAPGTAPNRCSGSTNAIGSTAGGIAQVNPDDSGNASYQAWTPAVGLLYRLNPAVNLYANAGRSFETPTFIELAYKPDGTTGLNLGLQPSKSNHYEVGAKAFLSATTRLNAALFQIDTTNEIVTATNAGGRTTFQNAGDTQRRGVEVALDGALGAGFTGYVAATYLDAKFKDSFATCTVTPCASPNAIVNAGNRIPGVPNYTIYGELAWRHPALGFSGAIEARWVGKVPANDVNTDSAQRYVVASLRAGLEQRLNGWRFTEFARVDNLFNEKYVGAIYVNDANARFFAPAPERNYLVGVSAAYAFQ